MPTWVIPVLLSLPAVLAGPLVFLFINLPWFRRGFWRAWYEWISQPGLQPEGLRFLNYGYCAQSADAEAQQRFDLDVALSEGLPPMQVGMARLYQHTVDGWGPGLKGLQTLEVGCGRGGGSDLIARLYPVAGHVGVDLAPAAVEFCRAHYTADRLSFTQGDALALPIPDRSVDVVINVESSHCYPDTRAFLREVHRVLRPGGALLLSDFRPKTKMPEFLGKFGPAGLQITGEEDLTAGVVQALEASSEAKKAWIAEVYPPRARRLMRMFAGVRGSLVHTFFVRRHLVYRRVVAIKPAEGPADLSLRSAQNDERGVGPNQAPNA